MNINDLRHVVGLNKVFIKVGKRDGCKPRMRTKSQMLIDIERKLDEGGPLLGTRSSQHGADLQLIKTNKKRPCAKDVVEQMQAQGKSKCQIRAALRARGFSEGHIDRTQRMYMDRPTAPFAKDLVEHMEAQGKSTSQIRTALRARGLGHAYILLRTKHMDPPIAGSDATSPLRN